MSATTEPGVNSADSAHEAHAAHETMPGLQLDKRQRAMLREMGIRVWTPLPLAAEPLHAVSKVPELKLIATDSVANDAGKTGAGAVFDAQNEASGTSIARTPPAPYTAPTASPPDAVRPPAAQPAPVMASSVKPDTAIAAETAWHLLVPQSLYADTASKDSASKDSAARWLVLAESPLQALQASQEASYQPFEGDAGKLLDNMLRAARLHRAASVILSPLVRQTAGSAVPSDVAGDAPDVLAELQKLVSHSKPDVILVMGRLASQAVLQSATPFGKLRGQLHQLHGVPTVVMQDAAFLLRNLPEKARAWDDLCLAMSLVKNRQST